MCDCTGRYITILLDLRYANNNKLHTHALVGVGVVVVVLDAPGLVRVDEGREHDGAHNILQQMVFVESPVRAVMANNKPLHRNSDGSGQLITRAA
eukprot:scaffold77463_cov18-Tisochrysis_lutea.AAC.1